VVIHKADIGKSFDTTEIPPYLTRFHMVLWDLYPFLRRILSVTLNDETSEEKNPWFFKIPYFAKRDSNNSLMAR
jgi:hypothetical protein